MGTLAIAAKVTDMPSMYLCEFPGLTLASVMRRWRATEKLTRAAER